MHRHLDPNTIESGPIPTRMYVQFDEVIGDENGRLHYRLSAVKADDFDAVARFEWERYWGDLFRLDGINVETRDDPFRELSI